MNCHAILFSGPFTTIGKILIFLMIILVNLFPQQSVQGVVVNAETKQPIAGVAVHLEHSFLSVLSDDAGKFSFSDIKTPDADISLRHISYEPKPFT